MPSKNWRALAAGGAGISSAAVEKLHYEAEKDVKSCALYESGIRDMKMVAQTGDRESVNAVQTSEDPKIV
jgi:hypothetical protein